LHNKSNIIFILTDDQGYGDVAKHGNPILKTPNMDMLCENSARFEDFCVSPSCSPSRCALMTGKHEFKSGVTHTIHGRNVMDIDSTTIAQLLQQECYSTGIFGKWHLGHEGEYRPEYRGFDDSLTTIEDTQDSHFDATFLRNGVEEQLKGYRTDILFEEANKFISKNKEKPFFCYIPTYSPHAPLVAPEDEIDKYRDKVSEKEATFFAMISIIDRNIGELMQNLKNNQLEDNTLVVLMNDNGATAGVDLYNANMRGCKGTSWFGGTRALSFWHYPKKYPALIHENLTAHLDLLPTFAELAGIPKEKLSTDIDGISLHSQLSDKDKVTEDRFIFIHQGRWPTGEAKRHKYAQCSVRYKQYCLVRNDVCDYPGCKGECRVFRKAMSGATQVAYSQSKGRFHYAVTDGNWMLFDVSNNPQQDCDISTHHPEIVELMEKAYDKWWGSMLPKLEKVS
jgi:arylsulfatase A-like enzyme